MTGDRIMLAAAAAAAAGALRAFVLTEVRRDVSSVQRRWTR